MSFSYSDAYKASLPESSSLSPAKLSVRAALEDMIGRLNSTKISDFNTEDIKLIEDYSGKKFKDVNQDTIQSFVEDLAQYNYYKISECINDAGAIVKDYDLNHNGSTADDVKVLGSIIAGRNQSNSRSDAFKALSDQYRNQLQSTPNVSAETKSNYEILVKMPDISSDTLKLYADTAAPYRFSANRQTRNQSSLNATVQESFRSMMKSGSSASKLNILTNITRNGIDGEAGQEISDLVKLRQVVLWYPMLASKDLNESSIASMMKVYYDGQENKVSKSAWAGYSTLWSKDCGDNDFRGYADFVERNPNLSESDYSDYAKLLVKKAYIGAYDFEHVVSGYLGGNWGASAGINAKSNFHKLLALDATSEQIDVYGKLVESYRDNRSAELADNYASLITSSSPEAVKLKSLSIASIVSVAALKCNLNAKNVSGVPAAYGSDSQSGIGVLLNNNPNLSDQQIRDYVDYVSKHNTLTSIDYTQFAQRVKSGTRTINEILDPLGSLDFQGLSKSCLTPMATTLFVQELVGSGPDAAERIKVLEKSVSKYQKVRDTDRWDAQEP